MVSVTVRDNNVDQALKVLKKKMQREGIFREMKFREAFSEEETRKGRSPASLAQNGSQTSFPGIIFQSLLHYMILKAGLIRLFYLPKAIVTLNKITGNREDIL